MNHYPYEDKEEIILLLKKLWFDMDSVNNTIETLNKMAKDPLSFVNSLMQILLDERSDFDMKKTKFQAAQSLAIVFLDRNNYFIGFPAEVFDIISNGIMSPVPSIDIKKTLEKVLTSLFVKYDSDQKIKVKTLTFVQGKLGISDPQELVGLLFLIEAISGSFECPKDNAKLGYMLNYIYAGLIQSGQALAQTIANDLAGIVKNDNQPIKIEDYIREIEVLKLWTCVIKQFIKKLEINKDDDFSEKSVISIIITRHELAEILIRVLQITLPTTEQLKNSFISTSEVSSIDRLLNAIKTNVLKCFSSVLTSTISVYQTEELKKRFLDENVFYIILVKYGVQSILSSLVSLCKRSYTYLEDKLTDQDLNECVSQGLAVLKKMVRFKGQNTIFFSLKNAIIMDICLPLIASSRHDLKLFQECPGEYIAMTEDVDAEEELLKLHALQLLYELCDHIDGGLSCVVMFTASLISYSMTSNNLNTLPEQYPILALQKESIFITEIEPIIRLESCLHVIASIPDLICYRADLIDVVDNLLITFQNYFSQPQLDTLVKIRMCHLLKMYWCMHFPRNNALLSRYLLFLTECMCCDSGDAGDLVKNAISVQATKALGELLSDDANVMKLKNFILDIVERMLPILSQTQNPILFENLADIICKFPDTIAERDGGNFLIRVVERLAERIQIEYVSLEDKTKQGNLPIIHRIWDIIKTLGDKENYLEFQDQIEELLEPVLLVTIKEDLSLEKFVLNYLDHTLKHTKKVSSLAWKILREIPKLFEKNQSLFASMFPVLNKIIAYGSHKLHYDKEINIQLIELALKASTAFSSKLSNAEISLSPMLLQLLIYYLEISEKQWEEILVTSVQSLKSLPQTFLKARFGGVLLMAFKKDFQRTQACIVSNKILDDVMDLFIKKALVFDSHSYDTKILVSALSRFFVEDNLDSNIAEKLPQVLTVLVSFLAHTQQKEQRVAQKKGSAEKDNNNDHNKSHEKLCLLDLLPRYESQTDIEIKYLIDDNEDEERNLDSQGNSLNDLKEEKEDDEDDDKSSTNFIGTEKEEANSYLKKMIIDFKMEDEFEVFRKTIVELKATNPELHRKVFSSLPTRHTELVREILKIQKIVVDADKGLVKTRKIVKVKRNAIRYLGAKAQ